jgi:hypothetical protein
VATFIRDPVTVAPVMLRVRQIAVVNQQRKQLHALEFGSLAELGQECWVKAGQVKVTEFQGANPMCSGLGGQLEQA